MVSTDPISDMLTRIRNAYLVDQRQVILPYSAVKEAVAQVLARSGYIQSAKTEQASGRKQLIINIADEDKKSVITEIKRISRPGKRVYVQSKEIPIVKRGRGMVIVSTSQGMMSGKQAAAKGLGGELICEVY